jgi:uncharacterized protein
MVLVGITDIHGDISVLSRLEAELKKADVVLVAGDVTNFGGADLAAEVITELQKYAKKLFAVPGNCDYPEVDIYLSELGINLHQRSEHYDGICFIGAGGSTPCPVETPLVYSEAEYEAMLNGSASTAKGCTSVLVSHQPPFNTKTDRAMKIKHVGSKTVRTFIEQYRPLVCLTGHIHESKGIDTVGKTTIVNPGPFKEGRYCRITIRKGEADIELLKV